MRYCNRLKLKRFIFKRVYQSLKLLKTSKNMSRKTKNAKTIIATIKDGNNNRARASNNTAVDIYTTIKVRSGHC